jgi:Holliday junction resolvase
VPVNPLESKVAKLFRAKGYYTVISAGSRGVADVVAIKQGEVLFIQCKSKGGLSHTERQTLEEWARRVGAKAIAAVKRKRRLRIETL